MDLHFIVGLIALTRGQEKACRDQAQEFANLGLLPLAIGLSAATDLTFVPIGACQNAFIDSIRRSASPSADGRGESPFFVR
jgi:hypothetical protein